MGFRGLREFRGQIPTRDYWAATIPLERRDLRREALFGWIRLVLTALSSALETAEKDSALGRRRIVLTRDLRVWRVWAFTLVRFWSLRSFFFADLISGITRHKCNTLYCCSSTFLGTIGESLWLNLCSNY